MGTIKDVITHRHHYHLMLGMQVTFLVAQIEKAKAVLKVQLGSKVRNKGKIYW